MIYASEASAAIYAKRSDAGRYSQAVEAMLAEIAALLSEDGADAIIVAGGETSGAVLNRLGVTRLQIGPEIAPGVPWTVATLPNGRTFALALKSGNFGGPDMFIDAWNLLP